EGETSLRQLPRRAVVPRKNRASPIGLPMHRRRSPHLVRSTSSVVLRHGYGHESVPSYEHEGSKVVPSTGATRDEYDHALYETLLRVGSTATCSITPV